MYFLAVEPECRCVRNSTVCLLNGTYPSTNQERCRMPRSEWEYNAEREYSLITYFDIHCDTRWMAYMATSIFFLGWATGSIILSWAADIYGRKVVIFVSVFVINSAGFISVFVPNMHLFIVCRFITGLFYSGPGHVTYVLNSEFVDTANRPHATIHIVQACAVSGILLGIKAYFLRQWKHLLVACTLPYMVIMVFYKFVPESIRFLHMRGLDEEAATILKRMAWWNKRTLPDKFVILKSKSHGEKPKTQPPLELFKTWKVAKKTFIQCHGWCISVLVFYGLTLAADDLGGSFYVSFVLINAIEIPSNILLAYLCAAVGRKKAITTSMIVGSLSCLLLCFIPMVGIYKTFRIAMGMFGKACVTITLHGLYIWSMELYKTELRSRAIGLFVSVGRFGAMASPWVTNGLKTSSAMIPFIVMGALGISAGCWMLLLTETRDKELDEEGNGEK